jgi:translation initiation factor 2 beta subunit (eIF-2beta)/eIF-5
MSNAKVYQGQSFLDKVLETTGSIDNAFAMAILNGMSITDDVVVGQELKATGVTLKSVVSIFNDKKRPATAITMEQLQEIESKGIGYMRIGTTFIVG